MILKSNSQYVPTHAELNIYHKLFSFRFLLSGDHLFPLLGILSLPCPDLHYATTSALVALLPLQHCGKEEGDDEVGGEDLLQRVVSEAFPEQGGRLQREGEGLLGELGVDEGAGLGFLEVVVVLFCPGCVYWWGGARPKQRLQQGRLNIVGGGGVS